MTEPGAKAESPRTIDVFFYGLFMDESLLRQKGVNPSHRRISSVENFCLMIGARATLVPCANGRVYGVVFSLTHEEVDRLYSEESVSTYRPEAVLAELNDGDVIPAVCFNLPIAPSPREKNPAYASQLRDLARQVGLPASYIESIH